MTDSPDYDPTLLAWVTPVVAALTAVVPAEQLTLVGALCRDLLHWRYCRGVPPRATNDTDIAVALNNWDGFEAIRVSFPPAGTAAANPLPSRLTDEERARWEAATYARSDLAAGLASGEDAGLSALLCPRHGRRRAASTSPRCATACTSPRTRANTRKGWFGPCCVSPTAGAGDSASAAGGTASWWSLTGSSPRSTPATSCTR